jgi:4-amino-4-deoxy-L-arabinose transferase-like glycosyltransferase
MKMATKVLIIGFILRLIPFVYVSIYNPEGVLMYDSYGYLDIADNLMTEQVFSRASEGQLLIPDISRTPTFPSFLLLLKLISSSTVWMSFVVLLLGSVNVLMTYKISKRIISSEKVAFIAAMIIAIDIPSIIFSGSIMSETLFTFLLLSIIFIILTKEGSLKNLIGIGLLFSVLILCRPIAIFLPFVLLLYFIKKKVDYKGLLAFILSSYLLVGAWSYRNYHTFNTFTLSSVFSADLYFYTSASILSEVNGVSTIDARKELAKELNEAGEWVNHKTEMAPMIKYCTSKAVGHIFDHPWIFTKQYATGVVYFFLKPMRNYIDTYLGINRKEYSSVAIKNMNDNIMKKLRQETSVLTLVLVVFQMLLLFAVAIFAFYGLIKSERSVEIWLFVLLVFYFALTSSVTEVDGRFRIPAIPFMAILSAIGFCKWRLKFDKSSE